MEEAGLVGKARMQEEGNCVQEKETDRLSDNNFF